MKRVIVSVLIIITAVSAVYAKKITEGILTPITDSAMIPVGIIGNDTATSATVGQIREPFYNSTTATRLAIAAKKSTADFNLYSAATQLKLNQKATTNGVGAFARYSSTAPDGTHYIDLSNQAPYAGPRTQGRIFHNQTAMYFVDGEIPTAKRMGSGSSATVDLSLAQHQVYTNTDSGGTVATTIKTALDELRVYFTSQIASLITIIQEAGIALQAAFTLDKTTANFPNALTSGSYETAQWTISNTGFRNLSTGTFTKSGGNAAGFYNYTGCQDKIIAIGGNCITTARFFSAVAGNYSGVVSMVSNDPSTPHTIKLYGSAISSYLLSETFSGDLTAYTLAGTTTPIITSGELDMVDTGTDPSVTSGTFTAQSTIYAAFKFRLTVNESTTTADIFQLLNGSTIMCKVSHVNGLLVMYHGTRQSVGGININADTDYYVWVKYVVGTGANGTAELYLSETTTKPTVTKTITTGTSTANVDGIKMSGRHSSSVNHTYIDSIIVNSGDIGDR